MSTTTHTQPAAPAPTGKGPRYRTPPGHRVLHLVIDQETFDLLHIQAIRSQMKFTAYMNMFLKEAFPYSQPEIPPPPASRDVPLDSHPRQPHGSASKP